MLMVLDRQDGKSDIANVELVVCPALLGDPSLLSSTLRILRGQSETLLLGERSAGSFRWGSNIIAWRLLFEAPRSSGSPPKYVLAVDTVAATSTAG